MQPSDRRATIVTLAGALLVTAYVFSFLFAQASPDPHELPVGLTGPPAAERQAEQSIHETTGTAFDVRRYADGTAARRAIRDREVYAALVLTKPRSTLLLAPAAGQTASMVVQRRLPRAAGVVKGIKTVPQVEEVEPLVDEDPDGQALNLTLLPLVIFGIVVPIVLASVASAVTVRRRLLDLAVFAILGGLGAALIAHVALHALPGPFAATAALCALVLFAVSSCNQALIALRGPALAGVAVVGFLIIGNVASGATVVNELLPGFWRWVGPWMPPGAGATAIRNVTYFDGVRLAQPLLVLGAYALVGAAGCLLLGGRRPAPQGEPGGPTPDAPAPVRAEAAA